MWEEQERRWFESYDAKTYWDGETAQVEKGPLMLGEEGGDVVIHLGIFGSLATLIVAMLHMGI